MKFAAFNVVCPYEIGDKVSLINTDCMKSGKLEQGKMFAFSGTVQHTITDIATIHYVKTGNVKFAYELDNSGKYVEIISSKNN